MKTRSGFGRVMDFTVSGYVYFVAVMLVLFMVVTLVTTVFGSVMNLIDAITTSGGFVITPDVKVLELQLLHTIAFTIVLVKAYKILIAYAETQHINIKFLVEIAIIGPTIELIFNSASYALDVNILFAVFSFLNLVAYLFFYKTLKKVSDDYHKELNT